MKRSGLYRGGTYIPARTPFDVTESELQSLYKIHSHQPDAIEVLSKSDERRREITERSAPPVVTKSDTTRPDTTRSRRNDQRRTDSR